MIGPLGTKATTILHSIKNMIEDGTIVRMHNGSYLLTNAGHIKASFLSEMINGLDSLDGNMEFWQSHDLSGIPAKLLAKIEKLVGGKCVTDEPNILLNSQVVFIEGVSKAREIRGVSPIIAQGYAEMVTTLLERGANISLILTKSIIDTINRETLHSLLSKKNFQLFEIPDGIRVAFTIADDMLFLGLYNLNGSYDPNRDLVCHGQEANEWGRELFEHYLKQSRPVPDH